MKMTFAKKLILGGAIVLGFSVVSRKARATGGNGARPSPPSPPTGSSRSVFLYGDSHAEGLTPHLRSIWSRTKTFSSAFHRGATARVLSRDDQASRIRSSNPDIVLIEAGTNDAAIAPDMVLQSAGELLARVRQEAPAARIAWVSPPYTIKDGLRSQVASVTSTLQPYLALQNVEFINIQSVTSDPSLYGPDFIHLKPRGYLAAAQYIVASLV